MIYTPFVSFWPARILAELVEGLNLHVKGQGQCVCFRTSVSPQPLANTSDSLLAVGMKIALPRNLQMTYGNNAIKETEIKYRNFQPRFV